MADASDFDFSQAPAAPQGGGNPLWAGVKSGTLGMLGSIEGAVGAGAQLVGFGNNNVFAQAAQGYNKAAQAEGRPDLEQQGWTGGGLGGALSYGAYRAGQLVPQLLGYTAATALAAPALPEIAAGGLLARAGMAAPEFLGGAGGATGAAAEAVGQAFGKNLIAGAAPLAATNVGDIYNDANQRPGGASYGDALKSFALGIPTGAIQAIAPHGAEGIVQSGLTHAGAFAIGSGLQEAAVSTNDPNMSAGDRASAILEAAAGGAVFGGLFGAGRGFINARGMSNENLAQEFDQQLGQGQQSAAPGPASPEVAAAPEVPQVQPSPEEPQAPQAPPTAPDLTALASSMAESRARQSTPDLKEIASKLGRPGPADVTPDQDAQLRQQMGEAPEQAAPLNTLDTALKVAEANGNTAAIDAIKRIQSQVSAPEPDAPRPVPSPTDEAKLNVFQQYGDIDNAIKPNTLMRKWIDSSQVSSAPELFNALQDEIDSKSKLSTTKPFKDFAARVLGDDDVRTQADALREPVEPQVSGEADIAKQLQDYDAGPRHADMSISDIMKLQSDRLQEAQKETGIQPATSARGQIDLAEVARARKSVFDNQMGRRDASETQPETQTPQSIADQVLDAAHQISSKGDGTGGEVPIKSLRAALPDIAPVDLDNALKQIHADDSGNELTKAPPGQRKGAMGVKIGDTGTFHNLSVEPRDAVQERSAAPQDVRDQPGSGTQDGSGDGSTPGAPGAQREQGSGEVGQTSPEAGGGGKTPVAASEPYPGDAAAAKRLGVNEPSRLVGPQKQAYADRLKQLWSSAQRGDFGYDYAQTWRQADEYARQEAGQTSKKAQPTRTPVTPTGEPIDIAKAYKTRMGESTNAVTGATELPPEAIGGTNAEAAQRMSLPPERITRPDAPIMRKVKYISDTPKDVSPQINALGKDLPYAEKVKLGYAIGNAEKMKAEVPASRLYSLVKNGVDLNDINDLSKVAGTNEYSKAFDDTLKKYNISQKDYSDQNYTGLRAMTNALEITKTAPKAMTKAEMKGKQIGGIPDAGVALNPDRLPEYDILGVTRQLGAMLTPGQESQFGEAWAEATRKGGGISGDIHAPADLFAFAKMGLSADDMVKISKQLDGVQDNHEFNEVMKDAEQFFGFDGDKMREAYEQANTIISDLQKHGPETLGQKIERLVANNLKAEDVGLPKDIELPIARDQQGGPKFGQSLGPRDDTFYRAAEPTTAEKALFKEVDWQKYDPGKEPGDLDYGQFKGTNPIAGDQRIEAQGYNTRNRLFRGMSAAPDPNVKGSYDPITKDRERGTFLGDTPNVSNAYTKAEMASKAQYAAKMGYVPSSLMPMVARSSKTLAVDWPKLAGSTDYLQPPMMKAIEYARKQGADMLVLRNIQDLAIPQNRLGEEHVGYATHTQYVVLNPEILRAQNAAFDPARINENNLLAKIAERPDVTVVPPDRATVKGYMDNALSKLSNKARGTVSLLDNASQLPQSLKDVARRQGVDLEHGDYTVPAIQHDGKVYVFGDHISGEAELQQVISHEVVHAAINELTGRDTGTYTSTLSRIFDQAGGTKGLLDLADKFGQRSELEKYPFFDGHDLSDNEKAQAVDEMLALSSETNDLKFTASRQANLAIVGRIKEAISSILRSIGLGKFADRFMGYGVADVQKWLADAKSVMSDSYKQPPNSIDLASLPGSRLDMLRTPGEKAIMPKLGSIRDLNEASETTMRAAGALYEKLRSSPISMVSDKLKMARMPFLQANDMVAAVGKQVPGMTDSYHYAELGSQINANGRQTMTGPEVDFERLATNDPKVADRFTDVLRSAALNDLNPFAKWETHEHLRDAPNRDLLQAEHERISKEANSWNQPVASKMQGLFRPTDKNLEPGALVDLYNKVQSGEQFLRNMKNIASLQADVRGMVGVEKVPGFEYHAGQDYVNQRDLHNDVAGAQKFSRDQLDKLVTSAKAYLQTADDNAATQQIKYRVDTIGDELAKADRGTPYTHFGRDGDQFGSFMLPANEDETAAKPEAVEAWKKWFADNDMGDISFNTVNSNRDVFVRMSNESSRIKLDKALRDGSMDAHIDIEKEPRTGLIESPKTAQPELIPSLLQFQDRLAKELKVDPAQMKSVLNSINHVMLDMAPQDATLKTDQQRMGVQGSSDDLLRNMKFSHTIALNAIGHGSVAIDKALADASMVKQRADMTAITNPLHDKAPMLTRFIDEFRARNAAQGTRVQSDFVSGLRNAAHAFYLAGSGGYLAMQIAQPWTLTLPRLAQHYSYAGSAKALARAHVDAGQVLKAVGSVHRDILAGKDSTLTTGVTNEALRRYVAASGSDAERARRQNIADYLGKIDSMGKLESGTLSYDNLNAGAQHKALGIARKAYQTAVSTATYAELGGRLVSGLSAKTLYDSAPEKARGFDSAHDYGAWAISRSMMEWGGASRARVASAGGPLGAAAPLMFQFHGFPMQLSAQIYQEVYNAIKGETPADRIEARRFLTAHLVAATALAGSLGLPFVGWGAAAYTKASTLFPGSQGEAYDVDAHYRDFLASIFGSKIGEVLAHGLPRFLNADFSDLGDKDLLPMQSFLEDRRKLEDSIPDYLSRAWGSSVGIVTGSIIGLRDLEEGRVMPGMAHFLPTALRNVAKAYQIDKQGYVNSQGEKMPIDASTADVIRQIMGIHSGEPAEEEERSNSAAGLKSDRQYAGGLIKQQIARAIETGDQAGQQRWMAEMQKFDANPQNAGMPIAPTLSQYLETRQRAVQYSQATKLPLGVSMKDIAANALLSYGGGGTVH